MKFDEAAILLNCHTFQDFPVHLTGADADGLLSAWTVLWHPRLIATTGRMPLWYRADAPPTHDRRRLLILPQSQAHAAPELLERDVTQAGGVLIRHLASRPELLQRVLHWLNVEPPSSDAGGGGAEASDAGTSGTEKSDTGTTDDTPLTSESKPAEARLDRVSPATDDNGAAVEPLTGTPQATELLDLAADFLALGFAYLQVELLTRQMRYSTRVAETAFEQNLVEAAQSHVAGDTERTRTLLQTCFDFLSQERDHYYAVDVYLVDLSLVHGDLAPKFLERQLAGTPKSNFLITGEWLERLQAQAPATVELLRTAIADERCAMVGGEYSWEPLPFLATETVRQQLEQGQAAALATLGHPIRIFGRHRSGLVPCLPALLLHQDYRAALHVTFDGGKFPEATQSKSRWEGSGQASIDAIMRAPLDASQPSTFLQLATSLSESMDMDHIATRCLVHWAGDASPWYDELKRVTRYTRALGKFVTLEEYFRDTYDPGLHDRFHVDDYRSPYLTEQATTNPARAVSGIVHYWRQYALLSQAHLLSGLIALVDGSPAHLTQYSDIEATWAQWHRRPLDAAWDRLEEELPRQLGTLAEQLVACLGRAAPAATSSTARPLPTAPIGVNCWSYPRRTAPVPAPVTPNIQAPVYASELDNGQAHVVLDVPACGWATCPTVAARPARGKQPPPMAEGTLLRNEFFEAHFDSTTGSLRGIRDYGSRSMRLSQQLTFRSGEAVKSSGPTGQDAGQYATMVGDSLRIVSASTLSGCIETRGRLLNAQQIAVAHFMQRYTLTRGSRTLSLEIELEPLVDIPAGVWEHYFAARFAWSNESTDIARSVNEGYRPTLATRLEAPLYIQLDDGAQRTTLLTGGHAFHRISGPRMLDTLLITRGESARRFHLGISIDAKQPLREALNLLAPPILLTQSPTIVPHDSGWLFHIDAKHVLLTSWKPLVRDNQVVGVQLRLLEVEGKAGPVTLQAFRAWSEARKTDSRGQTVQWLEATAEGLRFSITPHEPLEIEAFFHPWKSTAGVST